MPGHDIVCPYCGARFKDEEVHFRMKTAFTSEGACDPEGKGRTLNAIRASTASPTALEHLTRKFELRRQFLVNTNQPDTKYASFWKKFGHTTEPGEKNKYGLYPYQMPVIDPAEHLECFAEDPRTSSVDGIVRYAKDCFGVDAGDRVCPRCHNPLAGAYGAYPAKFISVIGITGAGKTVYLSQLCSYLSRQIGMYGVEAKPMSGPAASYARLHPVYPGKPLPVGTPAKALQQPLPFSMSITGCAAKSNNTFVFYDIAGENFGKQESMSLGEDAKTYGPFLQRSDAIILLIDPEQFTCKSYESEKVAARALDVIRDILGDDRLRFLPIAVCVSKADARSGESELSPTWCNEIVSWSNLHDIKPNRESKRNGNYLFCADDYNGLQSRLRDYIDHMTDSGLGDLHTSLMKYDCYNFFMIESIGADVIPLDGSGTSGQMTPAAEPRPHRIIEPILWILYKFGYIQADGPINWPDERRPCPQCGRMLLQTEFCPDCLVNWKGEWQCRNKGCGELNTPDSQYCAECGYDRAGNPPSKKAKAGGFGGFLNGLFGRK